MIRGGGGGNEGTRDGGKGRFPSGAKALVCLDRLTARLKPCAFKTFSLLMIAVLSAVSLLAQQANPADPEALQKADAAFRAGYAAQQAGHLEEARARFTEVVRLAPQIPEGREALGAVLLELSKPAEAISQLEAAARLKPNDLGIETNLAYAFAQLGQRAKAMPHFEAAIRLAQRAGE